MVGCTGPPGAPSGFTGGCAPSLGNTRGPSQALCIFRRTFGRRGLLQWAFASLRTFGRRGPSRGPPRALGVSCTGGSSDASSDGTSRADRAARRRRPLCAPRRTRTPTCVPPASPSATLASPPCRSGRRRLPRSSRSSVERLSPQTSAGGPPPTRLLPGLHGAMQWGSGKRVASCNGSVEIGHTIDARCPAGYRLPGLRLIGFHWSPVHTVVL